MDTSALAPPPEPEHGETPSLERMLLKFGLLTPAQLADAMREESATARPLWEIVQERGWVSRDDLVRLARRSSEEEPAAQPPVSESGPVEGHREVPSATETESFSEPTPAEPPVEPATGVEAGSGTAFRVLLRLANGERVEAHVCNGAAPARRFAEELVKVLAAGPERWPYFSGRFVRPESIVTVDVEAAL